MMLFFQYNHLYDTYTALEAKILVIVSQIGFSFEKFLLLSVSKITKSSRLALTSLPIGETTNIFLCFNPNLSYIF